MHLIFIALFGILLGSLVNYATAAWAWNPRYHNPWCRTETSRPLWYRIPIVGWFGMMRESNRFGRFFWLRPLLTEVAMGLFAVWFFVSQSAVWYNTLVVYGIPASQSFNISLWGRILFQIVFVALMVAASWIDFDEKTIPDRITVFGTLFAIATSFFFPLTFDLGTDMPQTIEIRPVTQLLDFPISAVELGNDLIVPLNGASPQPPIGVFRSEFDGTFGLLSALMCWWGWCFALMERHWRPQHGFRRAWGIFWTRLARTPSTRRLWNLGKWGTFAIVFLWATAWPQWLTLWSTLIGMGVAGGFMWLIRIAGQFAMNREAMGFGDVTLMAMFGAFLGWQPCLILFFIAPFAGIILAILFLVLFRDPEIPFGPFLCLAAFITMLNWEYLWALTLLQYVVSKKHT